MASPYTSPIGNSCPINTGRPDPHVGLDQVDRDVDIAPCGVGIRAQLVRLVHQSLGNFTLQTRQADVETGREAVSAASCAQVHFGVNRHVRWKSDLPFAGRELYRTEKTGRPAGGEKLLGVGAGARGAWRRHLNLKSPSSVREAPPSRPPVVRSN